MLLSFSHEKDFTETNTTEKNVLKSVDIIKINHVINTNQQICNQN